MRHGVTSRGQRLDGGNGESEGLCGDFALAAARGAGNGGASESRREACLFRTTARSLGAGLRDSIGVRAQAVGAPLVVGHRVALLIISVAVLDDGNCGQNGGRLAVVWIDAVLIMAVIGGCVNGGSEEKGEARR